MQQTQFTFQDEQVDTHTPAQAQHALAPLVSAPEHALAWIRACELPSGGLRVHADHPRPYPEVTGYCIPTLLEYGERDLSLRLVRWLVSVQNADGSYTAHDSRDGAYVFDTGQALRGLLASMDTVLEAQEAAARAADYLCSHMIDGGAGGFIERYAGVIPESIQLYVLPPLVRAAAIFRRPEYAEMAMRCADYYVRQPYALRLETLTHFLGYELEALVELGRPAAAMPMLEALRELQAPDGAVRAERGASWVCTPGLAQIAICWYRVGLWGAADRALAWLDEHQRPKGGFLGSYGPGANYWPEHEPTWAVKFYLDAHRQRVCSYADRHANDPRVFPPTIEREDGRVRALLQIIRPGDAVVEVGCGNGRILKALRQVYPGLRCTGVDIASAVLATLPADMQGLQGALEAVPCPDESCDVAFSVEAIEQSANVEAALAELVRITRPGGWVVIVGKPQSHWGWTDSLAWERWPDAEYLRLLLSLGCDDVRTAPVSVVGQPADGRLLIWRGRKRPR
ncbi:MAG TPA: methyltransferase domain-containing protein [Ktedonobacterales bacterium]|nr:methyltransferase domain-containing protein [Ktedonobacterales bacterium]